jgi:hypothetical protein
MLMMDTIESTIRLLDELEALTGAEQVLQGPQ